MIIKCEHVDKKKILDYIGNDYTSCLYLYLDLLMYGLNSDITDVYIQYEKNEITAILLRYYNCLHIYSRNMLFASNEIVDFFYKNNCKMIYCARKTGELIYECFSKLQKKNTIITNGWVAQIKEIDKVTKSRAEKAKLCDYEQIARLIFADEDIGKSYNYENLLEQLKERNNHGYARNYIIKLNNIIIAHACTNAELNNISVVAEILVKEEFRGKGFGKEILRTISKKLLDEGKEVYSFYYSKESRLMHKKVGFVEVCEWTKIVLDN